MIPNNVCTLCLTAAAGTELAGACYGGTVIRQGIGLPLFFPPHRALQPEGLHRSRGVAASGFRPLRKIPHCCLRRSLDRVSVPVWLLILSDQLPVSALVGHYPTNKLMGRRLIPERKLACRGLLWPRALRARGLMLY